jgi:solute carrier family 38 (sodium-coupled neutral amino acid transporter), member 11
MDSKHVTTLGVTSNLIISAAGAGILSFPFAIKQAGLSLGILCCLFFGFLNVSALDILAEHSNKNWNDVFSSPPTSFYDLILKKLGRTAGNVANASIYFGIVGALIGFLIIIAELACPVLKQWLPDDSFFVKRSVVIVFFVAVVAVPLSTVSKLKSLAFSSILAILSVLYVVFIVILRFSSSYSLYNRWYPPSWWSIFEAMPIMLFAYGCPLQTVTCVYELQHADSAHVSDIMRIAIRNTVCVCGLMYVSVGVFGFMDFGKETDGVILDNYGASDAAANVGRVLMAIHVALAYPVIFHPAQFGLIRWWMSRQDGAILTARLLEDDDESGADMASTEGEGGGGEAPCYVRVCTAVIVGTVTAVTAICIPQVEIVFG